jgi:hypothetical protein
MGATRGYHIGHIREEGGTSGIDVPLFLMVYDPYSLVDLNILTGDLQLMTNDIDIVTEMTGKFDFCVRAEISSFMITQVSISIHVLGDNVTVSQDFDRNQCMTAIFEDTAIGELVYRISACFRHSGNPETVTYTIISGNGNYTFSMDSTNDTIMVNTSLDYEIQTAYNLSVLVQDESNPNLNPAIIQIIVKILDVNDNSPAFEMAEYFMQVKQSTKVGTVLFIANATDADSGANSMLRYSFINESDSDVFSVNLLSGFVSLAKPLNSGLYNLPLFVSDLGVPQRTAYARVVIEVIDDNDDNDDSDDNVTSTTVVSQRMRHYFGSVYELSPKGTVIVTLTADDINDKLYYKIESQSNPEKFFGITSSGDVIVATPLNYTESNNLYNLSIVAYDKQSRPIFNATVTIQVLELLNKHKPQFLNGTAVILRVSEGTDAGENVGKVVAVDGDKGLSGNLTYSIVFDNSDGLFSIGPSSGYLMVQGRLDSGSEEETYQLVVQVTDGGTAKPNSMKKSNLTVTVVVYSSDLESSYEEDTTANSIVPTTLVNDSASTSIGVIAGIASGAFISSVTLTVIFVYCRLKAKRRREKTLKPTEQCVEIYLTLSKSTEEILSTEKFDGVDEDANRRPTPSESANKGQLVSEIGAVKKDDLQENVSYESAMQKNAAYGVV